MDATLVLSGSSSFLLKIQNRLRPSSITFSSKQIRKLKNRVADPGIIAESGFDLQFDRTHSEDPNAGTKSSKIIFKCEYIKVKIDFFRFFIHCLLAEKNYRLSKK